MKKPAKARTRRKAEPLKVFGIIGVRGEGSAFRRRVVIFECGSFRGWITEPDDTELGRVANGWRWSWRILTAGSSGRTEGLIEAALALEDSVLATSERYASIQRVIGEVRHA